MCRILRWVLVPEPTHDCCCCPQTAVVSAADAAHAVQVQVGGCCRSSCLTAAAGIKRPHGTASAQLHLQPRRPCAQLTQRRCRRSRWVLPECCQQAAAGQGADSHVLCPPGWVLRELMPGCCRRASGCAGHGTDGQRAAPSSAAVHAADAARVPQVGAAGAHTAIQLLCRLCCRSRWVLPDNAAAAMQCWTWPARTVDFSLC